MPYPPTGPGSRPRPPARRLTPPPAATSAGGATAVPRRSVSGWPVMPRPVGRRGRSAVVRVLRPATRVSRVAVRCASGGGTVSGSCCPFPVSVDQRVWLLAWCACDSPRRRSRVEGPDRARPSSDARRPRHRARLSRRSEAVSLSRPILTTSGRNSRAKVQSITIRSCRPQPGICSR